MAYLNLTLQDPNSANFYFFLGTETANLPLWNLTRGCTFVNFSQNEPNMHYRFRLERKPNYYFVTIGLPVILTVVLMSFSFVIGPANGEKVTYAMTNVLVFLVVLFSITEAIPADSSLPIALIFLIILLITSALATLACTIIRNLATNEATLPLAQRLNTICLIGYVTLTVVQFIAFFIMFRVHVPLSVREQERRGGCTYSGPKCEDMFSSPSAWLRSYVDDRPADAPTGKSCYTEK